MLIIEVVYSSLNMYFQKLYYVLFYLENKYFLARAH